MPNELTKEIKLDLEGLSPSEKKEVKEEVGEFVVNETVRALSSGKSPVKGERFKKLDPKYADEEKQGNRTPNLQLEGDMLEALGFKNTRAGIKVGIFGKKEADKADGHNQLTSKAKAWAEDSGMPKRRFIPGKDQGYKSRVESGINRIVKEAKQESAPTRTAARPSEVTTGTTEEISPVVGITIDDLFDDDFLTALLQREFNR